MTPEIATVIRSAVAQTGSGKEPRKHHLVPLSYLKKWAENDVIRVSDRSQGVPKTFTTNPRKAGKQTDFYRIDPNFVIGHSPATFEVLLSHIESNARSAFDALEHDDVFALDDRQVGHILLYLGHQYTRGRAFRDRTRAAIGNFYLAMLGAGEDDESLLDFIRSFDQPKTEEKLAAYRLLRDQLKRDPLSMAITREAELWQAGKAANTTAGILYFRQPVIYRTPRRLITCDEPLVQLHESMNAPSGGLWGAPIIVFPLSPTSVLALFRHDMPLLLEPGSTLTVAETLELNRSILGSTDRLAFEVPSMRLTEQLYVPDRRSPLQMNTIRDAEGRVDIIHLTVPKRWQGEADAPVRPVARWWPRIVPPMSVPTAEEEAKLKQFDASTHF